MNDIMIFENPMFGSVRTLTFENEPWFVGKDVADALGYKVSRNAIAQFVDEEDKLTHQISASGQNRNMTIINESGLYPLIFSSKLPSAKQFKRWVTSEVLPSIRRTGSYGAYDLDTKLKIAHEIARTPHRNLPYILSLFGLEYLQKEIEPDNPIKPFLDQYEYNIIGRITSDVYDDYCNFCSDNCTIPLSNVWFSRFVTKTLGIIVKDKKINGKKYRIFTCA